VPIPGTTRRSSIPWAWIAGIGAVIVVGIIGLIALIVLLRGGFTPQAAEEPDQTEETVAEEEETLEPAEMPFPEELAFAGVRDNDDWEPYIQDFDGVPMALVPAGCFMMGSESGDDNEAHEVCFDKPFWIDVYEVTNEQYGGAREGCEEYLSEDDQPRVWIDWFDSVAHCESRGARLPTEAEWEYAVRGPDGLVYPWGDDFVADNVVYKENSGGQTAPVGSKPGGISWVGVYDLSGNVWEWSNSLYMDYPYDLDDGREVDSSINSDGYRVPRGGAWFNDAYPLRGTYRDGIVPDDMGDGVGFRCARSYDAESAQVEGGPTETPTPTRIAPVLNLPPLTCIFQSGMGCYDYCNDSANNAECQAAWDFVEAQEADPDVFFQCLGTQPGPNTGDAEECLKEAWRADNP
jgi:hypothetical protein